jgi:hypothetical protein
MPQWLKFPNPLPRPASPQARLGTSHPLMAGGLEGFIAGVDYSVAPKIVRELIPINERMITECREH